MKSSEHIEHVLERLGSEWPNGASLIEGVMRDIESTAVRPLASKRGRILMKSLMGVAACLALGIVVWLAPFFALTPAITLAQVQAAVAKQKWLHVKYDSGEERWTTMDGSREYIRGAQGILGNAQGAKETLSAFDWIKGFWMRYEPGSDCIEEHSLFGPSNAAPPWKPKTVAQIVGFSLDIPEGDATAKQKEQIAYWERHEDTLDGRQLTRIDQYQKDAFGQYFVMKQIWVDAATHLPVRVRSWLQAGLRKELKQKYVIGEYDFPTSGPEDIYALGVPRNTPIVRDRDFSKPPTDVANVIESATRAHDRFPGRYRLIFAPTPTGGIHGKWKFFITTALPCGRSPTSGAMCDLPTGARCASRRNTILIWKRSIRSTISACRQRPTKYWLGRKAKCR